MRRKIHSDIGIVLRIKRQRLWRYSTSICLKVANFYSLQERRWNHLFVPRRRGRRYVKKKNFALMRIGVRRSFSGMNDGTPRLFASQSSGEQTRNGFTKVLYILGVSESSSGVGNRISLKYSSRLKCVGRWRKCIFNSKRFLRKKLQLYSRKGNRTALCEILLVMIRYTWNLMFS